MNTDYKPLIRFAWLRVTLYIIAALAAAVILTALYASVAQLFSGAVPPADNLPAFTTMYLFMALSLVGTAFLFRAKIDKRSITSMGFPWKGYRNHGIAGFALGILLICIGALILVMMQWLFFTGITWHTGNLLLSALLFIMVSFTEEIAFRGYILNNLMEGMNKWLALLISAMLFAAFHATNDNISIIALLNIFVAGILLGINYIFTRNLWFAIGLHFSWNFFQGPILGFSVSGIGIESLLQQTLKGPELLTGGAFGFEGSLICFIIISLTCLLLAAYYSGYRTRSNPQIHQ